MMQHLSVFRFAVLVTLLSLSNARAEQPAVRARAAQLKALGTTYNRAQSADWLQEKLFAVGRLDGTITVFRPKAAVDEFGPVLVQALATSARKGIQLVARVDRNLFMTSNDSKSLALWRRDGDTFRGETIGYCADYGVVVSASRVRCNAGTVVAVGHEQGYLSFWRLQGDRLVLVKGVSIRSPDPIEWQYQSWHIRGIASHAAGKIVTVSEDGDICLVSVPDGEVLARQRYNPQAQRGMNDVAVLGDLVAVVNCAVGEDDKNLWVYRIEDDKLTLVASKNLIKDTSRPQVFTFSVELVSFQDAVHFLASTQEGLVWLGRIVDDTIHVDGDVEVASEGGAVLVLQKEPLTILSVAHKIQTWTLAPQPREQPVLESTVE